MVVFHLLVCAPRGHSSCVWAMLNPRSQDSHLGLTHECQGVSGWVIHVVFQAYCQEAGLEAEKVGLKSAFPWVGYGVLVLTAGA